MNSDLHYLIEDTSSFIREIQSTWTTSFKTFSSSDKQTYAEDLEDIYRVLRDAAENTCFSRDNIQMQAPRSTNTPNPVIQYLASWTQCAIEFTAVAAGGVVEVLSSTSMEDFANAQLAAQGATHLVQAFFDVINEAQARTSETSSRRDFEGMDLLTTIRILGRTLFDLSIDLIHIIDSIIRKHSSPCIATGIGDRQVTKRGQAWKDTDDALEGVRATAAMSLPPSPRSQIHSVRGFHNVKDSLELAYEFPPGPKQPSHDDVVKPPRLGVPGLRSGLQNTKAANRKTQPRAQGIEERKLKQTRRSLPRQPSTKPLRHGRRNAVASFASVSKHVGGTAFPSRLNVGKAEYVGKPEPRNQREDRLDRSYPQTLEEVYADLDEVMEEHQPIETRSSQQRDRRRDAPRSRLRSSNLPSPTREKVGPRALKPKIAPASNNARRPTVKQSGIPVPSIRIHPPQPTKASFAAITNHDRVQNMLSSPMHQEIEAQNRALAKQRRIAKWASEV